jgi:subtilisin family serine protease
MSKYKCKLLPFEREDLLTIQEVKQAVGWEITAFNLPNAWKYTRGDGVKVAVLDTGVQLKHRDLSDNLMDGANFVNPRKSPDDDSVSGHGTHVAGIICAQNNEIGMVGVAPKCKVIPVKVLDKNGAGNLLNVAAGVRWAADNGADIIAMSLGAPKPVQQVRKAIQYAASKGVVTFCAAGNAGKTREIFYPAAYPETIGVGAVDENFDRANFSCTGDDLDFLAPGVKIFSTVPDNWYAFMNGTSMANPFMVGVAALVLSYKREKNLNIKLDTAEDYREIFRKYTTPTKQFAGKKFFEGFGIIDARKFQDWVEKNS